MLFCAKFCRKSEMTLLLDLAEILPKFWRNLAGIRRMRRSYGSVTDPSRFRHGSVTVPVGRALYTNFRAGTSASSCARPAAALREISKLSAQPIPPRYPASISLSRATTDLDAHLAVWVENKESTFNPVQIRIRDITRKSNIVRILIFHACQIFPEYKGN